MKLKGLLLPFIAVVVMHIACLSASGKTVGKKEQVSSGPVGIDFSSPLTSPNRLTEQPFTPHVAQDHQAESEQNRAQESTAAAHDPFLNTFDPLKLALFIFALLLAIKGIVKLLKAARGSGKATIVYSLSLGIRSARKVSGVMGSIWSEAKEVDKKATEAEHHGLH